MGISYLNSNINKYINYDFFIYDFRTKNLKNLVCYQTYKNCSYIPSKNYSINGKKIKVGMISASYLYPDQYSNTSPNWYADSNIKSTRWDFPPGGIASSPLSVTGPCYFELILKNPKILAEGIINFDYNLENVYARSFNDKVSIDGWAAARYSKNADDTSFNWVYSFSLSLPYNITTITNNIKSIVNKTINYNSWMDNITPIAQNMYNDIINNYILVYLRDAIDLKYNVNLLDNTIKWTYCYELMNGTKYSYNWTTKVVLPTRPIYKQFILY